MPTDKVKRTIIIEPGVDPDTGEVYLRLPEAIERVGHLMGALAQIGGIVRIVADRVKIGELPAQPGRSPELLGETVGFVIEYQAFAPLHHRSLTQGMMDAATAGDEGEGDGAGAAPAATSLASEILEPGDPEPAPEAPEVPSDSDAAGTEANE